MLIENLQKKDLPNYKELIDECFGESNPLKIYQEKYNEEPGGYKIFVAKTDNNKIAGSITILEINLFTFEFQPSLEIFNVCVGREYRGQKIAKGLFDHVIRYAKDAGFNSIHLTCLDTATDAHRLYESVGMKKTSSVKYSMAL